jgi:hypothetical protein
MLFKHLLRLLFCLGLLGSPFVVHAQVTPTQFLNGNTCSFNNGDPIGVWGPYVYGSGGIAYCTLTPPVHNYGQPIPLLNSVTVSGYARTGGSIRTRVCKTQAFAGDAALDCGNYRTSSGNFYDLVDLPTASNWTPTSYYVEVTFSPPFAALSGLAVVWQR